jgi:hypothetical protein
VQQVSFLNEAASRAKTSRANVSDSDGGGPATAAADAAPRIDPAHIQAALMGNRELQRLIVTMSSGGGGEALLHTIHNVYIDCLSTQRACVTLAAPAPSPPTFSLCLALQAAADGD